MGEAAKDVFVSGRCKQWGGFERNAGESLLNEEAGAGVPAEGAVNGHGQDDLTLGRNGSDEGVLLLAWKCSG